MVEDVEELCVQPNTHSLRDGNLFRQIHLGVGEMRSSDVVAAGVAELAVGGRISTGTCAGTGIDDGSEGIRVEPLAAASLRHARDRRLAIERNAGDAIRILWAAALKDAVVIGRIGCAEHTEGQSTMQEGCLRELPAAKRLAQQSMAGVKWNLINAKGREVMANVVITVAVLLVQVARQRRKNTRLEKANRPPFETSSMQWL